MCCLLVDGTLAPVMTDPALIMAVPLALIVLLVLGALVSSSDRSR